MSGEHLPIIDAVYARARREGWEIEMGQRAILRDTTEPKDTAKRFEDTGARVVTITLVKHA